MDRVAPRTFIRTGLAALLAGAVAVVVLLPWWRNHGYVRSFFDYGLLVGGVGRIEAGQRPYVDFISPAQAGWFFLNWVSEKVGGGMFQGMTLGGAACILISFAAFLGILARRWPFPAAALVAGALVAGTASQHTLWWYNPWGVVALGVAACASAVAPVLARATWGWHALAAAALFFGGLNKVNMQLVAFGLASAWAVRAGLTGKAGWDRVGATLLFYVAWLFIPVLAEMAWTGASFAAWWQNVIAMPAAARSGMLGVAFTADFVRTTPQDYYGPMYLQRIVPYGLAVTAVTIAAILRKTWREAGWLEKVLPVACGAVAMLGGAVLLTTNMDIAYIGLAGWLALLVGLWLGYELPARGAWFYGGLVLPVVVFGALAWRSAWDGQRSQFGHSHAARVEYVDGAQAGPDFAYLRGTRVPPEVGASMHALAEWRGALAPDRRAAYFFGPGTEWAAHIWPVMHTPGLPLSIYQQAGNSDGAVGGRIAAALKDGTIKEMSVAKEVDVWAEQPRNLLIHRYYKEMVGSAYVLYSVNAENGVSVSPIWFTRAMGGNADSRQLVSDARFIKRTGWSEFLGVPEGKSTMLLLAQSNRLRGEVVLRRLDGAPRLPAAARFAIYAQANPEARFPRWEQRVELPADQDEVIVPYAIDSSGMAAFFTVELEPTATPVAAAGWRGPSIQDTGASETPAPVWLFRAGGPVEALKEPALAALLAGPWRPDAAFMRNGRVTSEGVELLPGGEIWLKVTGLMKEFRGQATVVGAWDPKESRPFVHGMWYKAGRLEIMTQEEARESDRIADFHCWTAQPGGWLVIASDPRPAVPPLRIRVGAISLAN